MGLSIDGIAADFHTAYRRAIEAACEEAYAAAGGDLSRCSRENDGRRLMETIRVDGRPFRRVEAVIPSLGDPSPSIRIETTDLTKEPA